MLSASSSTTTLLFNITMRWRLDIPYLIRHPSQKRHNEIIFQACMPRTRCIFALPNKTFFNMHRIGKKCVKSMQMFIALEHTAHIVHMSGQISDAGPQCTYVVNEYFMVVAWINLCESSATKRSKLHVGRLSCLFVQIWLKILATIFCAFTPLWQLFKTKFFTFVSRIKYC